MARRGRQRAPRIYDVSLPIREGMIHYPGNPPPKMRLYSWIPRNVTNETLLSLGSHTGTHVDAPRHVHRDGAGADSLPLDSFYGPAQVLDLTAVPKEVHREDLEDRRIRRGDIILLKTRNSLRGYRRFRRDFVHVKLDAAEFLVKKGVKTLGCDYLSVKKFGGDDDVHELLIDHLTLFEGLDLHGVPSGRYMFLGLPLRINCDGGLARVLLVRG